jgi:hypothetical protein
MPTAPRSSQHQQLSDFCPTALGCQFLEAAISVGRRFLGSSTTKPALVLLHHLGTPDVKRKCRSRNEHLNSFLPSGVIGAVGSLRRHRTSHRPSQAGSPHGPQLSHRPRWRSHQRGARRCRLQLQPAPALVRAAFTRPLVDPLPRPLGRPASPNRCRKTFFTADYWGYAPSAHRTRRTAHARTRSPPPRVSPHGEGVPPRGARSHPECRIQP